MPVTRSRTGFYDLNLDQTNTTRFLFGDEDGPNELKQYQANMADDNFPTLTRLEGQPNLVGFVILVPQISIVSCSRSFVP